jgi:phosphoadenosine phosphosulfate reductase
MITDSPSLLERDLVALLRHVGDRFMRPALASSLSVDDLVLTHAIVESGAAIEVFVIDTGRLHAETLALLDTVRRRYGIELAVWRPDAAAVDAYVGAHGLNGFYDSVALRHECCRLRKVEPLARALAGRSAWLTGQRRAHGPDRAQLALREHDEARGIAKFNPLALWSDAQVWDYARDHGVPTNPLHQRGYPSIGCEPCTRAIRPGEPMRAGRWWWEEEGAKKECGLHLHGGAAAKVIEIRSE